MIVKMGEELAIGDLDACPMATTSGRWRAVVHGCKDPCHRAFVQYRGHLAPSHPEYLWALRGRELALNLIDPPVPLFRAESFIRAMDFMDTFRFVDTFYEGQHPVLIHCNNGLSRAPSLALVYMARRLKTIPDDSFAVARAVFETMVPPGTYQPGKGIETFLAGNWAELR